MAVKLHKSKLRVVFSELIRGYSTIFLKDYGNIVVKHPSTIDYTEFDLRKEQFYQEAKNTGSITEKEALEQAKEQGDWHDDKQKKIVSLELFLGRLKDTKNKLSREADVNQIAKEIEKNEKELNLLNLEKARITQYTCEAYANKKTNEFYIFYSFFKDQLFKERLFSEDEFEDLSDEQLRFLVGTYNEHAETFELRNIQRICLQPFFTNLFYLAQDDPHRFYGKPILELTFRQIELFQQACFFKHILSQNQHQPTDDELDNPEKIVDTYYASNNTRKQIGDKDYDGQTLVGASKKDNERAGIKTKTSAFKEEAKKQGKTKLGMKDLMKLHGVK